MGQILVGTIHGFHPANSKAIVQIQSLRAKAKHRDVAYTHEKSRENCDYRYYLKRLY